MNRYADFLLFTKCGFDDDIHTSLFAQCTAAQAQVIVLRSAPGATGVVLIVDTAALVFFLQTVFRALVRFAVTGDDAVGAIVNICVNESVQAILAIL